MNWDAIGAIAELIGAAGVVASFFYLAGQIRHNSRSVEAATFHSTMRARNELNLAVATNPELSSILLHAGNEGAPLSEGEAERFSSYMWGLFNLFEDSFVQHEKGLLPSDNWRSTKWALVVVLSRPGALGWVKQNMSGLSEGLQKEINSSIAAGER